jgi:hypothetical protein
VKILIISNISGNKEALDAVCENIDKVICIGDISGPCADSSNAIEFVKEFSDFTAKGEIDFQIGFDASCNNSDRIIPLNYKNVLKSKISAANNDYLNYLPFSGRITFNDTTFFINCLPDTKAAKENKNTFIFFSSKKFVSKSAFHSQIIIPENLGFNLNDPGYASYSIWQDGKISCKKAKYDAKKTAEKISSLPFYGKYKEDLINIILNGKK